MANNFVPAGLEDDEFSDEFMFNDEGDDYCDEFDDKVEPRSTTSTTTKLSKVTNPTNQIKNNVNSSQQNGWGEPVAVRSREDMLFNSQAVDDFRLAAMNGNVATVKKYIANGIDVDHKFCSGWTALMYAAQGAHTQVLDILLENEANANYEHDNFSVLMAACYSKSHNEEHIVECVNRLIASNADIHDLDRYHCSALLYASRQGRSHVVQALIKAGANINQKDYRGYTALMIGAERGDIGVVRALLANKADVDILGRDGSAFDCAVMHGHLKIQELLERVSDSTKETLVLTEEDIRIKTTDEREITSSLTTCRENGVKKYGELEMLLAGLELGHLIPLFHNHEVPFQDLLRMGDSDLEKMGVKQLGHRKKILDGVHQVHKKEWLPNSLSTIQYTKKITSIDALNMLVNLKKHAAFIASTVGYIGDQLREDSSILLGAQEGSGAMEISAHTEEAMTNVQNLYYELGLLQKHLCRIANKKEYHPADLIQSKKTRRKRSRLQTFLKCTFLVSLVGVVVWKSDAIVNIFRKL